jgi:glutathione peroxidase
MIYDHKLTTGNGGTLDLADFKGKVIMIVNTATGCGFTPQYEGLEKLYQQYKDQGFEILDFPCNQFGAQAPGTEEEIHTFCTGRFGITFPQFAKTDVNGEDAIPLYNWLEEVGPFKGFGKSPAGLMMSGIAKKMDKDYKNNGKIKWNFTKFLIDREGNFVERFEPTADMKAVEAAIAKLI